MVDADRAADLILAVESYVADIRRFRDEISRERFLADRGEQYKIEFPLQQAIQAALDLASHLAADVPGDRPDTLAGLFQALAARDLIEPDLATRLSAMARFRNLLVHQYADIEPERVWTIVTDHLSDLDAYLERVARVVEDA